MNFLTRPDSVLRILFTTLGALSPEAQAALRG